MLISLNVKNVSCLIHTRGADTIILLLEGPTPYPEMGYDGTAKIEVAPGYGVEWCQKVLGVEPTIIDLKKG